MASRKKPPPKKTRKAVTRPASSVDPPEPPEQTDPVAPRVTPWPSDGFPIVGIVASAGGLDAFKKFFVNMPATTGMAFVLVPHLDPTHESLMAALIGRQTRMPV